ncbi:MAG: MATE family efflux transporter [Clostridia bacterium]|nr:MATE family efflux transporter [Clostridia bacterium]
MGITMARIKLSEHFNYGKLLRFVLPSIIMMVFVSIYGIVDGFFVSNFVGELPFAALNLIFPLIMILGSVGFMLGTGGNAVVAKMLGEKNEKRANEIFSMLVYATIVIGVILSVIGFFIARPVAELFAANEKDMSAADKAALIEYCTVYARIILAALPMFMIQNAFQGFFVTAEKPRLGLYVTIIAGCCNIVLDALFVAVFQWGLVGAALATAMSQCTGGILPVVYFARKNDSLLRLGKCRFDGGVFVKVCINGLSELMTNISLSVVTILYNAQLMRFVGIAGVSAYGIMQYIGFIFIAVFLGYSVGSAPIIGYHFGAQNKDELHNVLKKSMIITAAVGIAMTLVACIFARPLAAIFVSYDEALLDLTTRGMQIYALSYLVCGFNIFVSAFFTALSNGAISLLISFLRTFIFQVVAVMILPEFFQVDGIWASVIVAEGITLLLTWSMLVWQRKRYGY